jgi:hypothetical protein
METGNDAAIRRHVCLCLNRKRRETSGKGRRGGGVLLV